MILLFLELIIFLTNLLEVCRIIPSFGFRFIFVVTVIVDSIAVFSDTRRERPVKRVKWSQEAGNIVLFSFLFFFSRI